MDQEKIILGIDPGTMVMGYGVIRVQGKQMELLTMGVINLKHDGRHQPEEVGQPGSEAEENL